ncbi:MAG: hypothetical protein II840_03465 [Kiritimatiellae bacterium]|nr:hypothetical protein [Kiritimatiellia bacterium]
MRVEAFRKAMAETKYIPAGSELHRAFHAFSQEALKITAKLNGQYHTLDKVRQMMAELTASEIDESFGMFPPFYTDCGKNIKIGKRVFINVGLRFRDGRP